MVLKTFGVLLLEKLATTGLAPDTRCSLLELCGVWSGQAQSQTTGRDARRTTAICRPTPGDTRTATSCKKDTIEFTNSFVSMKGGRASDRVFFNRCDSSLPSLLRISSTQPFPRRVLALPPGSGMAFDLAEKIDGSSGVPCVLEVTTCH